MEAGGGQRRRGRQKQKSIQITLMTVISHLLRKADWDFQDAGSPHRRCRESDLRRQQQVQKAVWPFLRRERQISQESSRECQRQQLQPLRAKPAQGSAAGPAAGSGDELVPAALRAVERAHHSAHHRDATQVSALMGASGRADMRSWCVVFPPSL